MMDELRTERLILRQWREDDFFPFYQLNSDEKVMAFFPEVLTREQSDECAAEIQKRIRDNHGWGFWAVEESASRQFIGFVGLNKPKIEFPFPLEIEIGWRLDRRYWGNGYATEAALKSLEYAFDVLSVKEVVAFTSVLNERSMAVMRRLGMVDTKSNFMHPSVDKSNKLCEHVLYKIVRKQWEHQIV